LVLKASRRRSLSQRCHLRSSLSLYSSSCSHSLLPLAVLGLQELEVGVPLVADDLEVELERKREWREKSEVRD
jgi:hypothetical protein